MREQVKFGLIRTDEEFEGLRQFAETFDHTVGPGSILPIYTVERGEQMIGYFNVLMYPIVAPSMHPTHCTARNFFDALEFVKHHFCLNSIDNKFRYGTCFLSIPTNPPAGQNMKDALERSGFKNTRHELWQAIL
jgi:hypothetical protein